MLLALLPCCAAAELWLHSYSAGEDVEWGMDNQRYLIGVREGRLALVRFGAARYYHRNDPAAWRRTLNPHRDNPFGPSFVWETDWDVQIPGFRFVGDVFSSGGRSLLVIHFAYVTLFFAVVPFACVFFVRRLPRWRRKARPGFCVGCGYDLRATPDRCPECGAVTVR